MLDASRFFVPSLHTKCITIPVYQMTMTIDRWFIFNFFFFLQALIYFFLYLKNEN